MLRRYSIRTDVDQVDIHLLDDKFKSENCVSIKKKKNRESGVSTSDVLLTEKKNIRFILVRIFLAINTKGIDGLMKRNVIRWDGNSRI